MKSLLPILLFILTLSTTSFCENKTAEKAATESAKHWLALADGGDYATSWDVAAPMLKNAVAKEKCAKMLETTRAPLGKIGRAHV